MPFRDHTEALRSRLEVLEADLSRAEAELETSRRAAAEAKELRATLAKIEAQLAEVRGERLNPRAQRTAAAVLAGGMALVVAGSMVARSTISHAPIPVRSHVASEARPVMLPSTRSDPAASWFSPRVFTAAVDEALGDAPVTKGARCDVLIAATNIDMLNCRVTVTCETELVYGGESQGYLPCRVIEGEPTTGEDLSGVQDDGDPMLDLDLPNERIIITNDQPSVWRLTLGL